jgi:glycine hydroxymethyltransferase
MIAFKDEELGNKASNIINSCLYSSPHTHHLIALSTTILELSRFGKEYAHQIIDNSNALGEELSRLGHDLRKANTGRWSENHQVHLFTEKFGDHWNLYGKFFNNHIAVNFDSLLKGGMFIRLGTQEITRRGMQEKDMVTIASFISKTLKGIDCSSDVKAFNSQFKTINYSFDKTV